MITATITAKITACARLKEDAHGPYARAFARSQEADGSAQIIHLWTADPVLMEDLLWIQAGEAFTARGTLTACLFVPVGRAEPMPLVDLCVETLEVESSLARWFQPRARTQQRQTGVIVQFPSAPKGAA